jgi:fatty-acyl-CoA synthase
MSGVPTTLVEALSQLPASQERGFRFVRSDGSERYFPFSELVAESQRRARILAHEGVRHGERVAIVLPEGDEFVLSFLGCAIAGAVPVPIFPRATFKATGDYEATVAHIVGASRALRVLCMAQNRALVDGARPHMAPGVQIANVEELFDPARDAETELPVVAPDDLCFLQFTSGSTGRPKGVIVTHRNLIANTRAFLGPDGLDRRDSDVGVSWLPLYHDMGLIGFVLGPLVMDIPVVLLPTASFARGPRVWLETIAAHKGTITYAPNFAYALAVKRLKAKDAASLDLSSLRVAGCGAEPIHADTLREFAAALAPARFDACALLPSYGMAESTLAITFHQRGEPLRTDRVDPVALRDGRALPSTAADALEVVSCGAPFAGHDLRIVRSDGSPAPEREVGEVWVSGPSVSPGYYENPEATLAGFGTDGVLRTGDLGYLAGGDLYVCGRMKDLIIIRGANYHPQDLEWAVSELPGVRRGNVVAFSVQRGGEERLVICAECTSTDAAGVRERVSARINEAFGLGVYEVVAVSVGTLPKTSSGKVQRSKTRALYEGAELERHA